MDPNHALAQIRRLIREYNIHGDLDQDEWEDLIDHVDGLDDWISRGGFLPDIWERALAK